MKVLMTLVLVFVLAGCAAGEGDDASSTTTQVETTTAYKEETTVLKGEGNLRRPPDSTLSYDGGEVQGTLGSYCWSSGRTGMCADAPFPITPPRKKTLTVPSGSETSTLTSQTVQLFSGKSTRPIKATLRWNPSTDPTSVTLTPSSRLDAKTRYTAKIKGGADGVKDLADNALDQDKVWSFTTGAR